MTVAMSSDGQLAAVSAVVRWPQSIVRVLRTNDGKLVDEFELGGVARELVFDPQGQSLWATSEQDRKGKFEVEVLQWDLQADQRPKRRGPFPVTGTRVRGQTRLLGRYRLSVVNGIFATTLLGDSILLVDMKTGVHKTIRPHAATQRKVKSPAGGGLFGGPPGTVLSAMAFSPDGYVFASAVHDANCVSLWPLRPGAQDVKLDQPDMASVNRLVFSKSGKLLAVGGRKEREAFVHVWRFL
jgi:WD40 repeat protein